MKAFPTTKPLDSWDDPNQGMDLRDYFAAKVLPALLFDIKAISVDVDTTAKLAYAYADAMMKARK